MFLGVLFAVLAALCGVAVNRVLRVRHLSLAPFSGLAAVAVLMTWCAGFGLPPMVSTVALVSLATVGAALLIQKRGSATQPDRVTALVLAMATALPILLLGVALAGVDTPVSTHDGAFHVETIDNLRRGLAFNVNGWYPIGFHASVAALLRLVPWVDTARGTADAAQALAILAPLAIFALGLAVGLRPRVASLGALVMALTYIYPYDDHLWGGWPLAMSLLLLVGLWCVAARWIAEPSPGLGVLGGLIAGAIVLTHGTEVYSALIGLAVIAALRWRDIQLKPLAWQLPLAGALAAVCVAPYLVALLGWAGAGGATGAGAAALDDAASQGAASSGGDWLEFVLGITGAASLIDLPVRAALLVIGARSRQLRIALGGWVAFGVLLFAASFVDIPPMRWLYVVTFPWLVHHRPPQMVVLFTSLLVGGGLYVAVRWFWTLRPRLHAYPGAWRRLAVVAGALLFFLGEGSAVSIFKTLEQVIVNQNVYSADDRAAMRWLQAHAAPGEMVINDGATDAGIWTPYKADLPILLPRSGASGERGLVAAEVLSLDTNGQAAAEACALHADYVYAGSRSVPDDTPLLPDRAVLERAPGLQEVFASGDAAVFRVNLACKQD